MPSRKDNNMRAKMMKVRKYDSAAHKWAEGVRYLPPNKRRFISYYEIVRDDGVSEFFDTFRAMSARREQLSTRVVYVRNSESLTHIETPVYIVSVRSGRSVERVRYYSLDNAVARYLSDDGSIDLIIFGVSERPLHYDEAVIA